MSAVITPFQGAEPFNTTSFNNRISQINTGFSYVSNPNLLDNWYFANPINQRGLSYVENSYALDRWKGTYGVDTNGTMGFNASGFAIQGLEDSVKKVLNGMTLTASILYVGGSLYTGTAVYTKTGASHNFIDNGSIQFNNQADGNILLYAQSANQIIAAKLELGPTQTLAHQDAAGNWVLNEVPDYGEQLSRCQRYALKIGDAVRYCSLGNGVARDDQFVSITIPTPVTMRTVPGLIAPPVGFVMRHSDTIISGGANFSVDAFSQNSIMLKVQSQVALTPGDMWETFLTPSGSIMFSADL